MEEYCSFATLIYVTDAEEEAVMRMYDWEEIRFENDAQLYHKAVIAKNGAVIYCARQDEMGFQLRPTVIDMHDDLIGYFRKAVNSAKNECCVHIGPMASGAAVVANRNILDYHVKAQFQETKGLEMEGYGVAYAAAHATSPRPKAIIAKSVCDFADTRKSDKYQKFAAYTSCEFVKLMLEDILDS